MENQNVVLLANEMNETWSMLLAWVEGLTDAEFFWEPVPGCWTVHTDDKGQWIVDYEKPAPDPPPFTTIAWKLDHLASCKIMYHEYAFGQARLDWEGISIPPTASESIHQLTEAQIKLKTTLDGMHDRQLEEPCRTNWGEMWPTWKIFWTMISHDLQHGSEISCLRDLFRATRTSGISS
jgi:hypothetical protein